MRKASRQSLQKRHQCPTKTIPQLRDKVKVKILSPPFSLRKERAGVFFLEKYEIRV
jgi:predicted RNA methylase